MGMPWPRKHYTRLLVLVIIFAGFFLRIYNLEKLAGLDYDQDISAWWIKQFLIDKKFSLIGQEISLGRIFIVPFYYYLLAPFYLIFKLDPIAANIFVSLVSLVSMYLIYRVGTILFNQSTGLIALLIYAFSSQINFYDRTTAPSSLIILLSLSSLYFLLTKRDLWLAPVLGVTFSVSPAAILLIFQTFFFRFKKKIVSLVIIFFMASPLLFFDLRHDFMITKRIFQALFSGQRETDGYPLLQKLFNNLQTLVETFRQQIFRLQIDDYMTNVYLNFTTALFWILIFLKGGYTFLQKKIFFVWFLTPVFFFSLYPYHVPEYYFLSLFPVTIIFFAAFITKKIPCHFLFFFLFLFIVVNGWLVLTIKNTLSMFYKKQAVKYIITQVQGRPFRVDYDIVVGQNNGFKYLFYWLNHEPSSTAKIRYIITVPENKNKMPGQVFGKIKVSTINE